MKKILLLSLTAVFGTCRAHSQSNEAVRQNVALSDFGTTVTATANPSYPPYNPKGVIDGNISGDSAVRMIGFPSEIVISFVEEREVNRVRIYPGRLENQPNPSYACAPLDYELDGYVNGGWAPLAKVVGLPQPTPHAKVGDYFFDHEFPSMDLSKLRLRITKSGDDGQRVRTNGNNELVPVEERMTIIREIQVFESSPGKHGLKLDRKTADFISGDFRLPFYRNQSTAQLDMFVKEQASLPHSIGFRLKSADGSKELRQFSFPLKPGKNEVIIDITGLPSGRYLVVGVVNRGGVDETFSRLLRIDNGTPALRQQDGADLTGKVLYLVDGYHTESTDRLTVKVNPAEPHFVAWAKLSSAKSPAKNQWLNQIGPLAVTNDNKLVVSFQTAEGEKFLWQHAICPDPKKPDQWEIHDGPAPGSVVSAAMPGRSRKWTPKTPLDQATFRFYERERDGIPPLDEIRVFHTGTVRRDFSGLPITYRGTYPMWEKRPGEILFLSKEPLLEDITLPGGETFEREKDTSDNFGGQMLSEDGKTYFYYASNVVKRFAPYIVSYDNQRNSNRLLSVNYTHDGFHWERQFILPVTDKDPWSLQQYGAQIFKDPEADIYWGYLASYNAEKQQIYIDVMFSRDLLNWSRPGDQPFIASSTVPDTWLFGLSLPTLPSLQFGGRVYHLLGATVAHSHFFLRDNNDTEFIRQRFEPRGLKQWPFFEAAGGYEGLSRSMQLAFTRRPVGVAISRPHGYFSLTAGQEPGILTTRALRSTGAMTINASTSTGGWIQVDLVSPEGVSLPGFSKKFEGNELCSTVFEKLPPVAFKIRLTLKEANVFSIHL
jgi:hypothetical protein